jgi:hypothetical protein
MACVACASRPSAIPSAPHEKAGQPVRFSLPCDRGALVSVPLGGAAFDGARFLRADVCTLQAKGSCASRAPRRACGEGREAGPRRGVGRWRVLLCVSTSVSPAWAASRISTTRARSRVRVTGAWSRESGLNRRPALYESAALPLSYRGGGESSHLSRGARTVKRLVQRFFFGRFASAPSGGAPCAEAGKWPCRASQSASIASNAILSVRRAVSPSRARTSSTRMS